MQGRRALTYAFAATLSVLSVLAGLVIAGDCDAADWMRTATVTALPLTAGIGAGVAVAAWSGRKILAVAAGLGLAAATCFAALLFSVACTT